MPDAIACLPLSFVILADVYYAIILSNLRFHVSFQTNALLPPITTPTELNKNIDLKVSSIVHKKFRGGLICKLTRNGKLSKAS